MHESLLFGVAELVCMVVIILYTEISVSTEHSTFFISITRPYREAPSYTH